MELLLRYCGFCDKDKPLIEFTKIRRDHRGSKCNSCRTEHKKAYRQQYNKSHPNRNRGTRNDIKSPQSSMLSHAKRRAKKLNLEFNLTLQDIKDAWPKNNICPITLQPFKHGIKYACKTSPTLDRMNNNKGYIKGNIAIISFQANACKQDVTDPEIFKRLAKYIKKYNSEQGARDGEAVPSDSV